MAVPTGIPPQLAQLLQGVGPGGSAAPTQNPLIEAIQNAMAQRLRTPSPDMNMPPEIMQNLRDDDPRRFYPTATPPADARGSADGIDTRTSYGQVPGEDKAAAMVQNAVEGKGTTYPKGDEAENHDTDKPIMVKTESIRPETTSTQVDPAEKMVADGINKPTTDANDFSDAEMTKIADMVENEDEAGLESYGLTLDTARKLISR